MNKESAEVIQKLCEHKNHVNWKNEVLPVVWNGSYLMGQEICPDCGLLLSNCAIIQPNQLYNIPHGYFTDTQNVIYALSSALKEAQADIIMLKYELQDLKRASL